MKFNDQSSLLSVVIIAFNWSERRHDFFDRFPIYVIENNPLAKHPKVRGVSLIQSSLNYGFAKAVNLGLSQSSSKRILILNDDCFITSAQIDALFKEMDANEWQAISPILVDEKGVTQKQYLHQLPTFLRLFIAWSPLHRCIPLPSNSSSSTLPGACVMIDRDVVSTVGLWDERFWIWWEDSDFSTRLGLSNVAFGRAKDILVRHVGAESFASLSDEWQKNVFFHSLRIYLRKYFNVWQRTLLERLISRFDDHGLYPVDTAIRASIVVPNIKGDLLATFLRKHVSTWDFTQDELIIVSSFKGISALRTAYPDVIFIEVETNYGFAHTVNIGFRRARGAWIGTVNDDTELPESWISRMVKNAPEHVGSLSPIVRKPNKQIESAGVRYLNHGKAEPIITVPKVLTETDTCNAAVVLFRRAALDKVGLFDELFGSYLEDIDLGLRLRRNGWTNIVVPKVYVTHYGQQTSSSRPVYHSWLNVKNWWLVVLKNTSFDDWTKHFVSIIVERGRNVSGLVKILNKS